jgi:nucleotide-binding universal stress UspA family protein
MSVSYPFRRILVPTDFSTCSDSALELGANLAADHGAELIALHVVDLGHVSSKAVIRTDSHPEGILVGDHALALAKGELTRRLDRLGAKVANRSCRVALGPPVESVCAAA